MKKNKIMLSVVSGLLVAAVAVGGTLAYLSDKSNMVTNTFNVGAGYEEDDDGHVGLWLDEIDIDGKDEEGNPAERTEIGNEYEDLQPGSIVEKDPTFHLTDGSVESYVFAEVKGLDALVASDFIIKPENVFNDKNSALNANWVKVDGKETLDGLYRYNVTVGGEKSYEMVPMFQYIKFDADVDTDRFNEIKAEGLDNITVRGVAVQAANLNETTAQVEAENVLAENVAP